MADLHVRPPTPEDVEAIVELQRVGLGEGRTPRTREFWEWKHLASPFGRSYLLVAESAGALVGLRAFQRWTWWSGETAVPAVRAVDTVTHPAWRGRGVFARLTLAMVEQMRAEGMAFVFNTPNERSRPGYLKMGWRRVGRLTPWVRPRVAGRLRRSRPHGPPPAPARALLQAPGLDALLEGSRSGDRRLATRPDRAYLAWRYGDVPGIPYFAAWDPDEPAAIVFRLVRRGRRTELRICEILSPGDRPSVRRLRRVVEAAARASGADAVTLLAPAGTTARRLALRGGFLPLARLGPVFTVRPLAIEGMAVDPLRRGSWAASLGAMELF